MVSMTCLIIIGLLLTVSWTASSTTDDDITIRNELKDIRLRLNDLEIFKTKISSRFALAAGALFEISPEFEGRRYYLSKRTGGAAIPVSEATCELFGGYLVEIDDLKEYRFVQNFIRNHSSDFFGVYTGGNDEDREGTWVYRHSKEPAVLLDWTPGQPTNDVDGDCLILLNRNDWRMDDFRCYYDNSDTRFMCEVPME
ncbi:unnamed protein product [Lymnaea stagnalis]|uniref:C-type lectin domain-containing protein n=1 Tax=Lymnaea stagnalis TaxID=6523 RepID=A0AAV2I7J1_LYMST